MARAAWCLCLGMVVAAGESGGTCAVKAPSATAPGVSLLQVTHGRERIGGTSVTGRIQVSGRQLLVDGRPLHLKGVNWNPVKKGGSHPLDLNFPGYVVQDAALMEQMGINAVRTYEPLTDRFVLDELHARGIFVLNTIYSCGSSNPTDVIAHVHAVKDHPAVLMWVIGNEWNYNNLYAGHLGYNDAVKVVGDVARIVKEHDPSHPVSSIYGGIPSWDVLRRLPDIDIWGINIYSGISFDNLFSEWALRSQLPMYIGEYGADAFNALTHSEDEDSQAHATKMLTQEIVDHSALSGGVCLGGLVFELADEWWKDGRGHHDRHDAGGIAPGGGPYPDATFNEEWWGLVKIDRTPRKAFAAFRDVAMPFVAESLPAPGAPQGEPIVECQTAEEGSVCHGEVQWAMTKGMSENPQWYPGLSSSSSFADFQAYLYTRKDKQCPPPC
mmetsp:Transcript_31994/g.68135  ORF Transcript_31994/g.68135 Transcript_31994/m.68135 type:complete len:440 (+) Transcript_31994:72-1391(+)